MHMEPGDGAKEEKKSEASIVVQEPLTNMERSSLDAGPNPTSAKKNEDVDELEKAKAEMDEVIEENQRLKKSLNKILSEYHTMQMQFNSIAEQDSKNSSDKVNIKIQEINEESELVSLSLGRLPSNPKAKVSKPLKEEENKEGLALGLDYKFEPSKSESPTEHLPNPSLVTSSEAVPKEEAGETWPPSKVNKTIRVGGEDEVLSQQNPTKKARVCVRARCDTPTLNDGCQWRKYGQKISKGNPCPRAYYRCTVAMSCPVRKQVQRCAQDMSILITTYEGTHNHPLPLSATAMASTTSAAASVLLSGSSTSHSGITPSPTITTTGMNFYLSDHIGSKSNQFYLSPPSLSASPSHPTITLDLTSNPPSSTSSPFRTFTSNYPSSSTSLNFSTSSESNAVSWSNGLFQSSSNSAPKKYNNMNIPSNINLGRQAMENNIYYSYMQRNVNSNAPIIPSQYSFPTDHTIAAATKAITADPTFQSALAAALTSVIGTGGSDTRGNLQGVGENLGNNKMKWGELFSSSSISGCASSLLLNKAPTTTQTMGGSLMCLQQQPLPFSTPKSTSTASPDDNRDNTN